jgi:hypothetical protein
MSNQITNVQPRTSPRPSHQSREDANVLHVYSSRLENHPGAKPSISDQLAPTFEDRQRLTARRGELADGLQPEPSLAEIAKVVGNMFLLFPSVRMGLDQTKAVTTAYVAHLKDLPLWAIEAGCKSAVAKGLAFPPSAPELRASAEQALQSIRDEEAAILKVLDAQVYHSAPKAERERIKAGFQGLLTELSQTNSVTPKPKPAFTRPKNGTPTTLSDDALRSHLAKYPPRAAE